MNGTRWGYIEFTPWRPEEETATYTLVSKVPGSCPHSSRQPRRSPPSRSRPRDGGDSAGWKLSLASMALALLGVACAEQRPAVAPTTVTQWEVAFIDPALNHGAGGEVVTDFCESRQECEDIALSHTSELRAAGLTSTFHVTSEQVEPEYAQRNEGQYQ